MSRANLTVYKKTLGASAFFDGTIETTEIASPQTGLAKEYLRPSDLERVVEQHDSGKLFYPRPRPGKVACSRARLVKRPPNPDDTNSAWFVFLLGTARHSSSDIVKANA